MLLNKFKKITATVLASMMLFTTTANVFAENNIPAGENTSYTISEKSGFSNNTNISSEDFKNQLKEQYPYLEVVKQETSEHGQVFYIDKDYY